MEQKFCRYNLKFKRDNIQFSYLETATFINTFFNNLSNLDNIFKELILVERVGKNNILLKYPIIKKNDIELANTIYNMDKYWLNKMRPNVNHDIYYKNHYGIVQIIQTIGKPLEVIKFSFDIGPENNILIVELPRDFNRDFDWYKTILSIGIKVFEPDYGGLYPVVIQKLEPPKITGGWISYFSEKMKISDSTFADCIRLPVTENKYMYAIEDQHMIQKNEEQFKKLENLVLRFKELNIQELSPRWREHVARARN